MTERKKFTDTDTTNRNLPHKLLINQIIPGIIPVAIPLIYQTIAKDDVGSGYTLHARSTIILKETSMDAARSAARVFCTPAGVSLHGTDRTNLQDGNTAIGSMRLIP